MFRTLLLALLASALCMPTSVLAQYPAPYDAYQAGADATRRNDARQRQAIKLQLDTIDQMKWYSAIGAAGFGTEYYRDPPSLDYVYATGRWSTMGGYGPSPWRTPHDIFQPWPYVPGDIWGYRWNSTVRQPIGRREIQTGPHRWESHPVYADELKKPTTFEEPVAQPAVPVTPAPVLGPRQF